MVAVACCSWRMPPAGVADADASNQGAVSGDCSIRIVAAEAGVVQAAASATNKMAVAAKSFMLLLGWAGSEGSVAVAGR